MYPPLSRGVGCIFYEMLNGKPMFPGSSVEEELELIFKVSKTNYSTHNLWWFIRYCGEMVVVGTVNVSLL